MSSVLFVCTYWGVRSQIAAELCRARQPDDLTIDSAGFESGIIGDLPRRVMQARGVELPANSPPTLFHASRRHDPFDWVITLCNEKSQENYSTLYDVVDLLFRDTSTIEHWDIPDFMAIQEEGEARVAAAEAIVDQIDARVGDWLKTLRSQTLR